MEHIFDHIQASMEPITLPITTARQLALYAQGLLFPFPRKAVKEDVRAVISRLGVVQIDTINIVARSPYFFLWSRLGDYDPAWLNELLEEKTIFEYWAHAACFLPMEDYPYHRRMMLDRLRLPYFDNWYKANQADSDAVLEHVKLNGEVRSSDFERKDGQHGTWWNWKVEKEALEYWFVKGELMISRRVNFQRAYDLQTRILPHWKDSDTPDLDATLQHLLLRSIASMGFALPKWMADYFRLSKAETQKTLGNLVDAGQLIPVAVEGWSDSGWMLPDVWESFQNELTVNPNPRHTTLLTPFDSLIWDRSRTSQLFGFDYTIECYLPASKRRYGYFTLPILHDNQLIGRADIKAHRAKKQFEVISLYLEDSVAPTQELAADVAGALQRCADWHQTPEVLIGKCNPDSFGRSVSVCL